MIIAGAKGFAKEVLEVLHQKNEIQNLAFFDNVSPDLPEVLYGTFPIMKTNIEVMAHFKEIDSRFVLGLGGPAARWKLCQVLKVLGGTLSSTISPFANIGHYNNSIGVGSNIMTGVVITNDVTIKEGCLINLNTTVGHDSVIGKFAELSPGVSVSGKCVIGDFCNVGTNATLLPGVKLGVNVVVGAGAVVIKDIPDNSLVTGIPATVKKALDPINLLID